MNNRTTRPTTSRRTSRTASRPKRRTRRGTVLVLILGALALISVITVVYVTIGQNDRRSAAVTVRRDNVGTVSQFYADYIADLVGRSVFATHVDGTEIGASGDSVPVLVRNAFDKPYTSPAMRSRRTGTDESRRFDPTGSYSTRWPSGLDPRAPGSPWLAAAEPSKVVWSTNTLPPQQYRDWHMHRLDWSHITNSAPNGRFVNLVNFRNNFDSRPGAQSASPVAVSNPPMMGERLSLLDDQRQPTTDLPFSAGTASLDIPAHWSMYQINAFRPVVGPWYNNPVDNLPNSPHYPHNQWVDADGDGFFDSRWFELIDSWDQFNIRELLPRDDRFRWFAAARIVDLSAMVNLNTASDFRTPARAAASPTGSPITPMGATPAGRAAADIDLRRLLLMTDLHFGRQPQYTGYPLFAGGHYAQYNKQNSPLIGESAHFYLDRWLRPQLTPGTIMSGDERAFFYEDLATRGLAGFQEGTTADWYEMSRLFGDDDLLELLTRRGINSPTTSRLEEIMSGLGESINTTLERRLGPLRDNRTLQDELYGLNTNQLLARAYYDVRQRLTTRSGARPLRPAMFTGEAFRGGLTEDLDLQIDAYEVLRAATRPNNPDPDPLFRAYAEALMPHAWRADSWLPERATLHYGHNAELALRTVVHLTANMAAAHSESNEHKGYSVLIDNSFESDPLLSDVTRFPFWDPRSAQDRKGSLDLGEGRLPDDPAVTPTLSARAINVYSVEAQPFLTQVVSMFVYTDAPEDAGGDPYQPARPPIPPNQPAGEWPEITIAGGINVPPGYLGSATGLNPDNLGQFIAFQLHNPFDFEIELTAEQNASAGGGRFPNYYLEYNGNLFRLADHTNIWDGGEDIKLRPGETRIAVVMSHELDTLENQWIEVHPNPVPPGGGAELVRRFLDRQFAIDKTPDLTYEPGELTAEERVRPWIIRRMNPSNGDAEPGTEDLFSGPANDPAKGTVYLWRTVTRDANATTATPGYREAHMLADRLRDPELASGATRATLDRSMPSDNNWIQGSFPGEEGNEDNKGFTIALWGSLKRPNDPGISPGGTRIVPRGAIPAYCIEAKWGSAGGLAPNDLQNHPDEDDADPAGLTRSDFVLPPGPPGPRPTGRNSDETFIGFLNHIILAPNPTPGATQSTLVSTLNEIPAERDDPNERLGPNLDGRAYTELYPEILLNNNEFDGEVTSSYPPGLPTLRIGDMLMPLAIGPSYDPAITVTGDPHAGRITLGEALALALNYSTPPFGDPNFGVLHNLGAPAYPPGGPNLPGVLDRGQLVLDRFAPFEDLNGNQRFEANNEPRRFPGIPLALNILNTFKVTHEAQPGSLTEMTPGLININTAPVETLRMVPLLSPTVELAPPTASDPFTWETWLRQAGVTGTTTMVGLGGLTTAGTVPEADEHTDIAPAVEAYREKIRTFDRLRRPNSFEESTPSSLLNGTPSNMDGRWGTTFIDGLRETPGFATRGELMAVVDRTEVDPSTSGPRPGDAGLPVPNQIDYLGQEGRRGTPSDARNSGAPGLNTARYDENTTTRVTKINEIPDSYDEKLLVANAAMGSISVRSDVFAVWLVLHGYQRSDVENLRDDDPMVPTIAKRFVMVIDRSNVTRIGQKPKVLLFKEVPMN